MMLTILKFHNAKVFAVLIYLAIILFPLLNFANTISPTSKNTRGIHNYLVPKRDLLTKQSLPKEILADGLADESGLIFEKEFKYRLKNNSYTDIIQLKQLSDTAQAIQFRLSVNSAIDDSTILIFQNLKKGADVSDSNWVLIFNVFKGDTNSIGASKDVIYALLYNLNQNGGLDPGDYNHLLEVDYRVAEIPVLQDSIKSSIKIGNAEATTNQGFPIDITPSRDEFKIIVRGNIVIPKTGLVFAEDTVYRLEDDSYIDIIQLKDLSYNAQGLQFKLLVNKAIDDNLILTFQNIQKGSDVSDASWILTYNVIRGGLTGNGASEDEVYVLLYNLNQNNGLNPGDYNELLKVKYRVANLPALQDSIKSSMKISNAEATTYQGFPIDISPSRDELTIIARNRVGFYGDVNGDGCLDVLDIIMVVDHIVGRDSLDEDEFQRADIAPWVVGNEEPDPDGIVNVQDLSLLQNIILTGVYPNGIQINGCSYTILPKRNGTAGIKGTFYITNDRITVYLNSDVDIRGVQIELGNVYDNTASMFISTNLSNAYYLFVDDFLRVLLYDRKAEKVIQAGENFLTDLPFHISNPEDITIEKFILIDANRQKIVDSDVEIIYGNPPSLPIDFLLYQNYPNPFNSMTTIRYSIPLGSDAQSFNVVLKLYDILGNEVAELLNEEKPAGTHEINFDAKTLSSGIYFYKMQSGSFVETKKMILLK